MLQDKVSSLKKEIIYQANTVKSMINLSCSGLFERDVTKLDRVFELEDSVNLKEMEIEEMTTSLIALYQPEARLLRTILMILKINNDLERIGDLAVNIAKNSDYLISKDPIKPYIDLPQMAKETQEMLNDVINAFINGDVELSQQICLRDDIVDNYKDQIYRVLITYMISEPSTIKRALHITNVAQCLERIADLSTNIAEDNIYICEGKVIKHHSDEEMDVE